MSCLYCNGRGWVEVSEACDPLRRVAVGGLAICPHCPAPVEAKKAPRPVQGALFHFAAYRYERDLPEDESASRRTIGMFGGGS